MDDNGANATGGESGARVAGRWHSVSQIRWPEPPAAPAPAPPAEQRVQARSAAPTQPVEKIAPAPAPTPEAEPAVAKPEPESPAKEARPPVTPPPTPAPAAPPFVPGPPVAPGPPMAPFPPPGPLVGGPPAEETEPRPRRRLGWLAWIAAAVLLAILAVGIGMALRQGDVNEQRDRADTFERRLAAVKAADKQQDQKISALQAQLNARSVVIANQNRRLASLTQQEAAARRQQAALNRQKAALDQREADLNERAAQLEQQQNQTPVTQPPAVVESTTFSDGLFQVGVDIPSGQYHTDGGATCYWATLTNSDANSIVNDNSSPGPQTITIDTPYFASDGCGTWTKLG